MKRETHPDGRTRLRAANGQLHGQIGTDALTGPAATATVGTASHVTRRLLMAGGAALLAASTLFGTAATAHAAPIPTTCVDATTAEAAARADVVTAKKQLAQARKARKATKVLVGQVRAKRAAANAARGVAKVLCAQQPQPAQPNQPVNPGSSGPMPSAPALSKADIKRLDAARAVLSSTGPNSTIPGSAQAYRKALASVSGANWVDQSNLPVDKRIGYPPGTPQHIIDDPYHSHMMKFFNVHKGEVVDGWLYTSEPEVHGRLWLVRVEAVEPTNDAPVGTLGVIKAIVHPEAGVTQIYQGFGGSRESIEAGIERLIANFA